MYVRLCGRPKLSEMGNRPAFSKILALSKERVVTTRQVSSIMEIFLIVVHVITSVILVVVILLQSGKGGGMGSGFGGAAAAGQQIFGGRGAATFLGKATVGLAAVFMATSLSLAYLSSAPRSALDLTSAPDVSRSSQVDQIIDQGGAATPSQADPIIDAPAPPAEEMPALEEAPPVDELPEPTPLEEALDDSPMPRP